MSPPTQAVFQLWQLKFPTKSGSREIQKAAPRPKCWIHVEKKKKKHQNNPSLAEQITLLFFWDPGTKLS